MRLLFFSVVLFYLCLLPLGASAETPQEEGANTTRHTNCVEYWYDGSGSQNSVGGMSTVTAECPSEMPVYKGHSWYGNFFHENGFCDNWPTPRTTLERETALYRDLNHGVEQSGIFLRGTLLKKELREICEDHDWNSSAPAWWKLHVRLMCCEE